eukprot:g20658.t1
MLPFLSPKDVADPKTSIPPMHPGELSMHKLHGVPAPVSESMPWSEPALPQYMGSFFGNLPYFAFGSLDRHGRPWCHFVAGPPGEVIAVQGPQEMRMHATHLPEWDPLLANLRHWKEEAKHRPANSTALHLDVWAGLGVDFSNRRRNKVGGYLRAVALQPAPSQPTPVLWNLTMSLGVNEVQGNCPKYINTRVLQLKHGSQGRAAASGLLMRADDVLSPQPAPPAAASNRGKAPTQDHILEAGAAGQAKSIEGEGQTERQKGEAKSQGKAREGKRQFLALDEESRALVQQVDAFFLATVHLTGPGQPSMDVNIRGGPAGFVRVSLKGDLLAWPDYSGNRIYSSLGNIHSDGLAGLVFPNLQTGDVLMITGRAEVLTGAAARKLMPKAQTCISVRPTALRLARDALGIATASPSAPVGWSPYNPPVRELADNKTSGLAAAPGAEKAAQVTLLSAERVSGSMATLRFRLDRPLRVVPGQYLAMDFQGLLQVARQYKHMNEADPQALNRDYVRTYTISHTHPPPQPAMVEGTQDALVTSAMAASFTANASSEGSTSLALPPVTELSITVKLQQGGLVSTLLHSYVSSPHLMPSPFATDLMAVEGHFSCFTAQGTLRASRLLLLAAGSGVTPCLAFAQELARRANRHASTGQGSVSATGQPHVVLLWSLRAEDLPLSSQLRPFQERHLFVTKSRTPISRTPAPPGEIVYSRRVNAQDIAQVPGLRDRLVFLCGPKEWLQSHQQFLQDAGVDASNIVTESFNF